VNDDHIDRLVALALDEDLSLGDVTSEATIELDVTGEGVIRAKEPLVFAGQDVAQRVFDGIEPHISVNWHVSDGDYVDKGQALATVRGAVRPLLAAERTVLNFLQRLCGVATLTRRFVDAVSGLDTTIVDTRKTTPGWRVLQKAAVVAGGGRNHRFSLGTGVLIKDNHVDSGGGIAPAIAGARAAVGSKMPVQVEVRNMEEVHQAIAASADMILLDNMDLKTMRDAVGVARSHRVVTEASGGVNLHTVRGIAETGVDRISIGALTHSALSVDINMKVHSV
jgi:nicotinate-nucleotide pyrophosphorylase (carboxylating)